MANDSSNEYVVRNVISNKTKKPVSKLPIISESDDYFIINSLKAYSKTDHYAKDVTYKIVGKVKERTSVYDNGLYYDGYNIGTKKFVLNHMKELIELGEAIFTFLENSLLEKEIPEDPS